MIQNDDSPDGGIYIDGVDLYNENPTRLGCYTTGKSKLLACMQIKSLLEKGPENGMRIYSDKLLFELQNFVAAGGPYQAKSGCTDDTIMSLAVVMKLLGRLASYDDKARKMVYENIDPDADMRPEDPENDPYAGEPIPFTFL